MSFPRLGVLRRGFSLIELLVVMAVLIFAIGLLVPMIQWLRNQAAQQESQNNIKQIVLGLHSCQDAFKKLPPAIGFFPGKDVQPLNKKPAAHGTVFHHILPFVEQNAAFQTSEGMSRNTKGIVIPIYTTFTDFTLPPNKLNTDNQGAISYAVNGYVLGGGTWDPMKKGPPPVAKLSLATISQQDGTSNTIAIAERFAQCVEVVKRAGGQLSATLYQHAWSEDGKDRTPWSPVVWRHDLPPQFNAAMKAGVEEKTPCNPEAYQALTTTIQIGLFDGHARPISAKISPLTWSLLMQHDDGQVLGNDF